MAKVIIYTTNYCRFCLRAKTFLRSKEVPFEEIDVTYDPPRRAEMERLSARRTVPQIFIDGQSIGGYDDIRLQMPPAVWIACWVNPLNLLRKSTK